VTLWNQEIRSRHQTIPARNKHLVIRIRACQGNEKTKNVPTYQNDYHEYPPKSRVEGTWQPPLSQRRRNHAAASRSEFDSSSGFFVFNSQQHQHKSSLYLHFSSTSQVRLEDDSTMSRSPETTRLDTEVDRLRQQFGTVSTPEKVAEASHYCSMLHSSNEDDLKDRIWRRYVRQHCDYGRVCNEITMYRLMGHSSHFFVHNEHLDSPALEELCCAMEFWVSLAIEGGLTPLLQHEEVKTVYEGLGSAADIFRAYIDTYKTEAGITTWTKQHMSELRYSMYQRIQGIRVLKKESSPSNPPILAEALHSTAC
jgi:hypothetical protein